MMVELNHLIRRPFFDSIKILISSTLRSHPWKLNTEIVMLLKYYRHEVKTTSFHIVTGGIFKGSSCD